MTNSITEYSIDQHNCTNILFVNNTITDYTKFVSSLNNSTGYIVYSNTTTKTDILELLRSNRTIIERVAFANYSTSLFLDNLPFFSDNDNSTEYDTNTQFIIDIITEFQIKHIDFLACNSLKLTKWQKYYNVLTKETGVTVGASDDLTGNLKYGGDWIMENTCENIELIYFNENIKYYEYLFDIGYHTAIIINNQLLVCGLNVLGQLGLSDFINRNDLNLVTIPGKTIQQVSTGSNHTAFLTTDEELYTSGYNDYGYLGLGNIYPSRRNTFTLVTIPEKKIKQVSCCFLATGIVTIDGELYMCGDNTYNFLGVPVQNGIIYTFTKARFIHNGQVIMPFVQQVYLYDSNSAIVLTLDNILYINDREQSCFTQFIDLNSFISSPINIKQITTNYILTTDGKLYTINYINYYGNTISQIILTGKTIQQISNGPSGNAGIVTTDGELYTRGENFYGQLGLGDTDNRDTFTKVDFPTKQIQQVYCYSQHTAIVTTDLEIYTCGLNDVGQLGLGDYINRSTFTKVTLDSTILDLLNPLPPSPPPPPHPSPPPSLPISTYIQFGNANSITGSPTIPVTPPFMMKSLFTDNSRSVYKPGSLASCGVGTTTNSRRKSKYT